MQVSFLEETHKLKHTHNDTPTCKHISRLRMHTTVYVQSHVYPHANTHLAQIQHLNPKPQ